LAGGRLCVTPLKLQVLTVATPVLLTRAIASSPASALHVPPLALQYWLGIVTAITLPVGH
jgi:hypothetical protein